MLREEEGGKVFPFMANKERRKRDKLDMFIMVLQKQTQWDICNTTFSLMTFEHLPVPETRGMHLLRSPQEDGIDGLEKSHSNILTIS